MTHCPDSAMIGHDLSALRSAEETMQAETIGALVNGAIPILGGLYVTLLGFRVVGKKPGESLQYDEWHRKHGGKLKVLGPLVALFGLFFTVLGILRAG